MRRAISSLLAAALLLGLLSACRKTSPDILPSQPHTARELVDAARLASGYDGDGENLEYLTAEEDGGELLTAYIENAYHIPSEELPWEDAAVLRATGASAFEIAVLRMADSEAAVRAGTALMSYTFARQGDFAGYAPAEANMAANGGIMQDGPVAALFICPYPDAARAAVEAVLNGKPVSEPNPGPPMEPITDVKELRDFLVANTDFAEAELTLLDGSEELSAYTQEAYGLISDQWDECAIARDTGDSAFEIAVFRVKDAVGAVEQSLNVYLNNREAQFDPSTANAELLHQAVTIVSDHYVVMLACPAAEDMALTFAEAAGTFGYSCSPRYHFYLNTDPDFSNRCAFTAPNKDDMSIYDTSAILDAWKKGDPSELSNYDRKIYDQARKVLLEVVKDGMSDYEKEKAVYSWVVRSVNYDWTHQNILKKTPRESYTPYGGLVNHTAVCLGYATTFQLLMDLAGVECITVAGAAFSSQEDHGWNMVRLNGTWYCVDVTWDANLREHTGRGRPEDWDYFNVTSDYMADTDHQWDYANTPEATAGDHGRS